jgi:hypothetical protein
MWSSNSEYENELVVIREQRINRSRLNFSEIEGSYEYTDGSI